MAEADPETATPPPSASWQRLSAARVLDAEINTEQDKGDELRAAATAGPRQGKPKAKGHKRHKPLFEPAAMGDAYAVYDVDLSYVSLGLLAAPRAALTLPAVAEATAAASFTWNERFQALVDRLPTSPALARRRMAALEAVQRDFGQAALELCQTLGSDPPLVAGEMVVVEVRPVARLWGGQGSFETKSLKNMLLAQRCLLQAAVPGLTVPLTAAVDVADGRRFRVQAAIPGPLSPTTSTFDEELNFGVRGLPADAHLVTAGDGRTYALNLSRLLPPETPRRRVGATLLPADAALPAEELEVQLLEHDSLDEQWLRVNRALHKRLGPKVWHVAIADPRRRLFARAGTGPLNERATRAAGGTAIHGDAALVTFCGGAHEVCFELLRPELLDPAAPVVVDALTAWSAVDHALGVLQVGGLSRRLHAERLPAVARAVEERGLVDPAAVKAALHEAGASLRHLGELRALVTSDAARAHLLLEMVARAGACDQRAVTGCFPGALSPAEDSWDYDLADSLPAAYEPMLERRMAELRAPAAKGAVRGGVPLAWVSVEGVEEALRARVDRPAGAEAFVDCCLGDDPTRRDEGVALLRAAGCSDAAVARYLRAVGDVVGASSLGLAPPSCGAGLARALLARGDVDEALAALPEDAVVLRALCLQLQGNTQSSLLLVDDDAEDSVDLARLFRARGETQRAEAVLRRLVADQERPSFANAEPRLELAALTGDLQWYEGYLRDAGMPPRLADDTRARAAYELGSRRMDVGYLQMTLEALARCDDEKKQTAVPVEDVHARLGALLPAAEALPHLELAGDKPETLLNRGLTLKALGHAERAMATLREAAPLLTAAEDQAKAHLALAELQQEAGAALESYSAAMGVVGDGAERAKIAFNAGLLHEQQGEAEAALAAYASVWAGVDGGLESDAAAELVHAAAADGQPTVLDALQRAAALHARRGAVDEARGLYQSALRLAGRVGAPCGGLQLQLGTLPGTPDADARALLEACALPEADRALGIVRLRMGDAAAAEEALARVQPRDADVLLALGRAAALQGESARAADWWAQMPAPLDQETLVNMGVARRDAGQFAAAAEAFERAGMLRDAAAMRFHAGDAEASLRLLLRSGPGFEASLGPVCAAVEDPAVVLSLLSSESGPEALSARAAAAHRGGDVQAALDLYLELAGAHPSVAAHRAAAALAQQTGDLPLAASSLSSGAAIAAGAERAELLGALARLQAGMGAPEQALATVEEAFAAASPPAFPLVLTRVQLLLQAGDEGGAREVLSSSSASSGLTEGERAELAGLFG